MCTMRDGLGLAMTFWIFFLFSCHSSSASAPVRATQGKTAQYSITIHQRGLAPRHQGNVTLICELTGITDNQVRFYWWLEEETNVPIYINSKAYNIDEITEGYSNIIINEIHAISEGHISSVLTLNMNLTSNDRFKCEFTMMDHMVLSDVLTIDFEEPSVEIALEYYNSPVGTGNMIIFITTCNVTASDGKPKMSVQCSDASAGEIISQDFDWHNQTYHFTGRLVVVMRTVECLQITCTVTDARGIYKVTKNISLYEYKYRGKRGRHNVDAGLLPTLVSLGIAILAFVCVTLLFIREKRAKAVLQNRLDASNYPPIQEDFEFTLHHSVMYESQNGTDEDSQSLMTNGIGQTINSMEDFD